MKLMRRRKRRKAVVPVPGAIPLRGRNSMTPWEISQGKQPWTDLHAHKMVTDLRDGPCGTCGEDHAHATRLHEMGDRKSVV